MLIRFYDSCSMCLDDAPWFVKAIESNSIISCLVFYLKACDILCRSSRYHVKVKPNFPGLAESLLEPDEKPKQTETS